MTIISLVIIRWLQTLFPQEKYKDKGRQDSVSSRAVGVSMETPPGDGMARVLAVACTTAISLFTDPLFSLQSPSSAPDKKCKPEEFYWPPVLALQILFEELAKTLSTLRHFVFFPSENKNLFLRT